MDMVIEAEDLLKDNNRDLQQFGWMLQEAWEYKKSLSSSVSSSAIDEIYNRAIAAGALGGKILGAGGGGIYSILCSSRKTICCKKQFS